MSKTQRRSGMWSGYHDDPKANPFSHASSIAVGLVHRFGPDWHISTICRDGAFQLFYVSLLSYFGHFIKIYLQLSASFPDRVVDPKWSQWNCLNHCSLTVCQLSVSVKHVTGDSGCWSVFVPEQQKPHRTTWLSEVKIKPQAIYILLFFSQCVCDASKLQCREAYEFISDLSSSYKITGWEHNMCTTF